MSRNRKRVLICVGTRPDIIKMAPVIHALRDSALEPVVLHTGQHRDLAWPIYDFFGIAPDLILDLNRRRPSLAHLNALLMESLSEVMEAEEFDAVLVHGDTTSAFAAAMTAFWHKIPVGHVEAGLRSHSDYDPFPEEKNRELTTRVARWHFAPTEGAVRNLVAEGVPIPTIHCVGNTIVDASSWTIERIIPHFTSMPADEACVVGRIVEGIGDRRLIVVTAHRRENWDGAIHRIAKAVRAIAEKEKDVFVVWPIHPNPIVGDTVRGVLSNLAPELDDRVLLTGPINYPQMVWLLRHARAVLTDSGGIQEEAAALQVPVLVLRNTTERPELIDAGGGMLVGTREEVIAAWARRLINDDSFHDEMAMVENPFGDGRASRYIANILQQELLVTSNVTPISHAA